MIKINTIFNPNLIIIIKTVENEKAKLFWDFNIYTEHVIKVSKPNMVLVKT